MRTINILLIDDEANKFNTLLQLWLNKYSLENIKELNFNIATSLHPEEAVELLKGKYEPDLVILDLYYGSGNENNQQSLKFLHFIKENHSEIPVLILSSTKKLKVLSDFAFSEEYKPDGFLSKDETINKGKTEGILDPNFRLLYDEIIKLLQRFGKLKVKNGILITHGTDTMSWAFAILRYGLSNVRTNIVLTGSQLPLEGTFSPSDAIGNMLTSVKLLNKLVPPNIIQVFNDGVHIFNKNLNKVKKWSFDAFTGHTFGIIENEEFKVFEQDVNRVTRENKIQLLHFIKTGGTIDAEKKDDGLTSTGDFTTQYIKALQGKYFDDYNFHEINPKDSSLFTPYDWSLLLKEIESTDLAKADICFDWRIFVFILTPFMTQDFYSNIKEQILTLYSGIIILGYGAGNVNIFGSEKTKDTIEYKSKYEEKFKSEAVQMQNEFSIIPLLNQIEEYNRKNPNNYKFVVMSSQVPFECYDSEYQAGNVPLYYGALPSGDLSYPEAQTKLAFILGHKDFLLQKAKENNLSYEQLVKSAFLSGVKFIRELNKKAYLKISAEKCNCIVIPHKKNLFVKMPFEEAIEQIISLYR